MLLYTGEMILRVDKGCDCLPIPLMHTLSTVRIQLHFSARRVLLLILVASHPDHRSPSS